MDTLTNRWLALQEKLLAYDKGISFSLEGLLLVVGLQEVNSWKLAYTKEEKQDLMHVGTCQVLSQSGYYEYTHQDEDGWPHYKSMKSLPLLSLAEQENFLKDHVLFYFENS